MKGLVHLLRILDPLDLLAVGGYVFERFGVVDGKDQEEALTRPHVLISHGRIFLLTGCVQNVQQTRLAIDDHLFAVGIFDGWIVFVNEMVLDELYGKGAFTDASG